MITKLILTAVCAGAITLFAKVESKSRGKGSWNFDRMLLRGQGAFACAVLYIWLS